MGGFVLASDWHLSRLTWQHRPRLVGDSFFALEQIVSICIERQAALVAPGDLCDKDRPDSAAVVCLCTQMQRMQDARLPVYYTEGQHEMAVPPWMSVHPWPQFMHKKTFSIGPHGPTLYGLNWLNREAFAEAAKEIPLVDFLMCHQVWYEHMGGVVTFPEANISQVSEHVRFGVLSGDYHKHQITNYNTPSGPKALVSSGAISVRNLGELDNKAVYYFSETGCESVPLRGRPWVVTQIVDLGQLQPLREQLRMAATGLPEYMQTPICVLQFPSTLEGAYAEINRIFGDTHLWPQEQRVEMLPVTIEQNTATVAQTIPDLIASNVPEGDVRDDLIFLMDSHLSPTEAVKALVTRIQGSGANAARTTNPAELVQGSGQGQ